MKRYIIALDGPASSGKSTTAKILANRLQYVYIDTGAMYRACALAALNHGIDLKDLPALEKLLSQIVIDIQYSPEGNHILLDGEDVSARIREADITKLSSEIAVIGLVRRKMVELQRKMGEHGGIVMDGRDIGTVVFPHADFKFFIVADLETRAYRRWLEQKDKGITLEQICEEMVWRDHNDSTREVDPLRKAEDAIEIDTGNLTIDEQVNRILEYVVSR